MAGNAVTHRVAQHSDQLGGRRVLMRCPGDAVEARSRPGHHRGPRRRLLRLHAGRDCRDWRALTASGRGFDLDGFEIAFAQRNCDRLCRLQKEAHLAENKISFGLGPRRGLTRVLRDAWRHEQGSSDDLFCDALHGYFSTGYLT